MFCITTYYMSTQNATKWVESWKYKVQKQKTTKLIIVNYASKI